MGKIRWNQGAIRDQSHYNCFAIESKRGGGGGGDHDELEIFQKICLIHFTNRSKVEFIKGEYIAFKGKFGPKIVADWCGRGSGLQGSWERFPWAASWLQSRDESAPIWRWISSDRGAIGPWSNRDREPRLMLGFNRCRPIQLEGVWCWFRDGGSTIVGRSGHDRTAIVCPDR